MEDLTTGQRLRAWRLAQEPRLTLEAASTSVGVSHPTWVDWEKGSRSPSLTKAMALELLTGGDVAMESWGFDAEVIAMMRQIVERRGAQALTSLGDDDPTDPALDEGRPSMVA